MTSFSSKEKKPLAEIEKSLIKKYRKELWRQFTLAIKDYKLVNTGDKIGVAISGGKDSLLLAKLFQELKLHSGVEFELEFIAMDPGYHPDIRKLLEENCEYLRIPVKIFDTQIFAIANEIAKDYPCYMCAKMRRGALYEYAKKQGCNKLALGHHFNDVIETTMLNVLYAGSFKTMLPNIKAQNFENMELIRPLYYIEEKDIIRFIEFTGITALNCACMVTAKKLGSKREEVKQMIEEMKKVNPLVDKSIFKSAENVYLDCITGWNINGKKQGYLDDGR